MSIRDLGYHAYEGEMLPHRTRYGVLIRRTLSMAWMSGLVKTVAILGAFPMVVCVVVVYFKLKAMHYLSTQNVPLQLEDPGLWVFYCVYWCQIWFVFSMSLLVAAPAISDDVRTGAFQFYFSRPVDRGHYAVGKLVPVGILLLALSAGPAILVAAARLALSQDGASAMTGLSYLLSTLVYAPIFVTVIALPPVALSALSRSTGTVQGVWTAVFFISWVLGEGTAAASDLDAAALLSIPTCLRVLGHYLYGVEPAYALPWYLPAGVLLLVVGASAAVIAHRLSKVEVFA